MNQNGNQLTKWLFETDALRVCQEDQPFWYTSGSIGPYYINTHFLYGSEGKANELLAFIDQEKEDLLECPVKVLAATALNYKENDIFRGLIDEMCRFIEKNIPVQEIDFISGGERRDWFFSLLIAEKLKKPHLTIYKNLKTVLTFENKSSMAEDLKNKKVLHIADLINEASSYERAWVPAIKALNGKIAWSVVVVDRKQGGEELLKQLDIESLAMVYIDSNLFENALKQDLINEKQNEMIQGYIQNPKESMKEFISKHPEFLENALKADRKTQERAKLCIEKKIYG